jgi:dipeptidyl aminopeptidase/acylaminoacyl peptidase
MDNRGCLMRTGFAMAVVLAAVTSAKCATNLPHGVTVDDLATRVQIISWSVSPDGRKAAFASMRASPIGDDYEIALDLCEMSYCDRPSPVASYRLPPKDVYDPNSHAVYRTVAQYVWSLDSKELLYTAHVDDRMVLRVRAENGEDRVVLPGDRIEITRLLPDRRGFRVRTFRALRRDEETYETPQDAGLVIRDGYRFFGPLNDPKKDPPLVIESWEYVWGTAQATRIPYSRVTQYWPYPEEWHWNGESLVFTRTGPLPPATKQDDQNAHADRERSASALDLVLASTKTVIRERRGGTYRDIAEENARFDCESSEATDQSRNSYISDDGRVAVLLKSTNLVPDELVKLDLETGKRTVLFAPNENFLEKTKGITVRYVPIDIEEGLFYGRLYLPAEGVGQKPYPLVIATYLSTPGFLASVGDELPVLSLVGSGIAVFSLHARAANKIGKNGDFAAELLRVDKPRRAIEWVVENLAKEGVVARDRIGLHGLSYGAEIAMYAYWKSSIFRAVSAATGTWEPLSYAMGGVEFSAFLDDRGFGDPNQNAGKTWKQLSAGQNARATAPPLLWQSPEWEQTSEIESWLQLRRSGAQVEWLQYPAEGHVKRSPANLWWVNQRNLAWFLFWLKDVEASDYVQCSEYGRWREMRKQWEIARGIEAGAHENFSEGTAKLSRAK